MTAQETAGSHWEYIRALLETHDIPQKTMDQIAFHYQSAFVHGWKHGKEDLNIILTRTG